MGNIKYLALGIIMVLFFISCSSVRSTSAAQSSYRTISLGNEKYSEDDYGDFISWQCNDYVYGGAIQVEVGYFENPIYEGLGFILFDGGNTGELTSYRRKGLDLRWDWGPNISEYAFVIETDGAGLYYDFTNVEAGESTKAKAIYKCRKR